MKNAKMLLVVLTLLLGVSLSCTFLKDKVANLGNSGSVKVPNLPPFDPNGPMVSPSAYVMRILAETEPAVAGMVEEVEAAERKLMKQAIDSNQPSARTDDKTRTFSRVPSEGTRKLPAMSSLASQAHPVAAHLMFQSGEIALPTTGDGVFFGGFTGYLKKLLADATANEKFNKKDTASEPVEGGTSTMTSEIGINPDGSSVFELGMKTETVKNGVKVTTEFKSRIEGQDCPNAEGQVPITIKLRLSGQSGSSRYEQDVTAFVRLVVDDSAEIASTTIDITQATARGRNGSTVFVETGVTAKGDAGQSGYAFSNERLIREAGNGTAADRNEAANSGYAVAFGAANTAIATVESTWKGGACIKIEATSPGKIDPGSGIEIPVKVRHKKDGSEVAAKLDAKLEGEASIDPTLVPKTPGTLMYVAPGESGKIATIKLKATSRRGIANLDLTASTGTNSYRIAGGLDDWYTNTVVCDITKPFTLTGGGFTMKFSGGLSGTYEYTGPFNAKGTGTYEISLPNGPGRGGDMIGRGGGTITGDGKVYKGSGTENYTLYTVDGPCVDGPVQEE